MRRRDHPRPKDIRLLAAVLIVFGLGEIWVGIFGNYLGILTRSIPPSVATAIVGSFYCFAGVVLLFTRRAWGTTLTMVLIGCEILGRIYLVLSGIAPSGGPDLVKIVIGGLIAAAFILYIGWRSFQLGQNARSGSQC